MKLALGTVQFGLPYGIANTDGQVTEEIAKQILKCAGKAGINTLDTAIAYGNSEKCLGNIGIKGWRVITKLPAVPKECLNVADWVNEQFESSLSRLGVNHVAGLMLHQPEQLLGPIGQELWLNMQDLKMNGLVEKIGYSIYAPTELDLLWTSYQPDIIQAPYNVFDQRQKKSGWLKKLHDHGVEIHFRSIFLQGLLLMNKQQRPDRFNQWQAIWEEWDQWLQKNQLSALEACLGSVMSEKMADCLVVGVDSVKHLNQILEVVRCGHNLTMPQIHCPDNSDLINPAKW